MTSSNHLFGNVSTIYTATAKSPIFWLLRISQVIIYCKSTNCFTTGNRLNVWLLSTEKLYDNFKSPIWKYFDDLYGYYAKNNFLATAHHTIILLLRISHIFVYCKSTNYFNTGNLLHIWLLCVEKLYDNFKSRIWNISPIYMATAQSQFLGYCQFLGYYFATAHLPII